MVVSDVRREEGLSLDSQAGLLARAGTLRRKVTLKIGHRNLISVTVVKRDHRLLLASLSLLCGMGNCTRQ